MPSASPAYRPPADPAPGRAVLLGLIGRGIGPSRTPRMHEVEGARHGLRLVYRRFDVAEMGDAPPALEALLWAAEISGFAGVNVTHPFKSEAVDHADALSDAARSIGAANTIVFRDGRRIAHNTDHDGFVRGFRDGLGDVALSRVLLVGAGGAGAAVARGLIDLGVGALDIHDADPRRARSLADSLAGARARVRMILDPVDALEEVDGMVNATPMGMAEHPGVPIPLNGLHAGIWVADIVYFPIETALLRAARERGCRTLDGSGMAVFQAVEAFRLFTGLAADPARMRMTFDALGPGDVTPGSRA